MKWKSTSDGMMKWDDMRLNKSGTIGTEPISKGGDRYTELKFGKLGAIDIPTKKTIEGKLQRFGGRIRQGIDTLRSSVRKGGIHIADDKAILGKK